MKIIISPAKKINDKNDFNYAANEIHFKDEATEVYNYLKSLSYEELKSLYNASDKIVTAIYDKLNDLDPLNGYLTAIFAYDGIQYQTMNPSLLEDASLTYLNENLFILSALYGALRPFDKIIPYRLEMQAKINYQDYDSLYKYWNHKLYDYIMQNDEVLINLASNEYSKAIVGYAKDKHVITIAFKEHVNDKYVEKGVYVKMARGAMVRYLAEHLVHDQEDIKAFNEMNYQFNEALSNANLYVFTREG